MKRSAMILLLTVLPMLLSAADTNLIMSGGQDHKINVWDEATGTPVRTMTDNSSILAMILTPDQSLLISGGSSHVVRIWNYTTGMNIRSLSGHQRTINALAISPNGTFLFSADGNGPAELRVWNFADGSLVRHHTSATRGFYAVAVSKDNQYYFAASDTNNHVNQWYVNTGALARTLNAVNVPTILTMATSTSEILFVGGYGDFRIRAFNISTGALIGTLSGHTDFVNALRLSADEFTLYSASNDRTLRVWNTSNYTMVTSTPLPASLFSLALSASTDSVYAGGGAGLIYSVNVSSGTPSGTLSHGGSVYALAHVRADPQPPTTTEPTTTATTGDTTPTTEATTSGDTTPTTEATTTAAPVTAAPGPTTPHHSSGAGYPGAIASMIVVAILFFIQFH